MWGGCTFATFSTPLTGPSLVPLTSRGPGLLLFRRLLLSLRSLLFIIIFPRRRKMLESWPWSTELSQGVLVITHFIKKKMRCDPHKVMPLYHPFWYLLLKEISGSITNSRHFIVGGARIITLIPHIVTIVINHTSPTLIFIIFIKCAGWLKKIGVRLIIENSGSW